MASLVLDYFQPALRTPEHLDRLPDLSPQDLKKVQDSKAIHSRGRDLFEAVACKGGVATVEQVPGSMAWLEPDAMPTLKKFRCHIAWVDVRHALGEVLGARQRTYAS